MSLIIRVAITGRGVNDTLIYKSTFESSQKSVLPICNHSSYPDLGIANEETEFALDRTNGKYFFAEKI